VAQAIHTSTTRRAVITTVTGAAVLAAIPIAAKLNATTNLTALSNEFDRLAAYEKCLWRGFDGLDANTQAAISATQARIDDVIDAIDALPGTAIAELKLKARAAVYFEEPDADADSCIRERLVAVVLNHLAAS
jgi:hypothetical protein